ncbi:DUF885 family protein [Candidatus Cyanaurora vandensis]|uniref:DUF885 domain-containing protein n=1 Tax=Candidatus Cyanaurora vandensis TaxID=2714958 RepID=UPI00257E2E78|nr:DUF885 domain-containing protein [Candidatus Cyanaurora vandensis]
MKRLGLAVVLALSTSLTWVQPSRALPETTTVSPAVQERVQKLNSLLAEQWEHTLRTSPEFASILGDKRYNDQLSDFSQAMIERDIQQDRVFLTQFEALDPTGFPAQDRLNHSLMVRNLRQKLAGVKFKEWEMPVNQFIGVHIDLPQLVTTLSFTTVKDYEDYHARLKQVPRLFNETMIQMRQGMKDGLMPPQILLVQVAEQAANIAQQQPDASPFAQPLTKFPKEFSPADQQRLRTAILTAIQEQVLPTYRQFTEFVRQEYAPRGRTEIGTYALPQGNERYAYAILELTTTQMPPAAIHELGLKEVARIETEKLVIAKKLGYSDLKSFSLALKQNPDLHPKSRQQILDEYRRFTDQMWAKLPQLFGRLPKAKLAIFPVEPFREKQASGAQYSQGTPDGSRPGHVFVNTYDYTNQLTITNESTAYHEGVPGHHMQISIAQELPGLPPFRQQADYTAYIEGWALYSEALGKEIGFYQNPYSDYGRLEDEVWRAIRLVVDTGIHDKKWTREQVVQYMRDHSSEGEAQIQSETDRYIAWPAQALAYKLGQLTIQRLRTQARQELGDKFDIRAFHDEVLGAGALPLDVLEARLQAWTAGLKTRTQATK